MSQSTEVEPHTRWVFGESSGDGPSALQGLSAEQKERLVDALDRYFFALEEGIPLDPESLIAEHPDLSVPLQAHLRSVIQLHEMAAGFAQPGQQHGANAAAADDDAQRLGDYLVLREIGRGGMGVVYEARQISLNRRVALKVLPFASVLDSQHIVRFKNEAQAAAQLQHPNIVPVFAVGVERGVHYYAMQFIEGQTLAAVIDDQKCGVRPATSSVESNSECGVTQDTPNANPADIPNSEWSLPAAAGTPNSGESVAAALSALRKTQPREYFRRIVELAIQAAEALQAAHSYGIVHRDIKPSNLLLDADGKLWVTDFGLARFQTNAAVTKSGDIVGTQRYMSPEQALGQGALIDQRSDIYSLGVTLYELLTLRPAFACDAGPALLRQIDQEQPVRPRSLAPRLPLDLETVVLRAMARLREERYLTAQDFADDLRRVLDGKPTVARPPTIPDRIGKWARRHRRVVAGGFALATLLVIVLATGMFLLSREKANTEKNYRRAEMHFRQARETVDRFGSQLAERLRGLPGAEHVRREVLEETLAYYQRFVVQAGDDPALRSDLAMTYSNIGAVCDEIGAFDEAIAAYQKALPLFEQLAADQPAIAEYLRHLGVARNNLALALSRSGRTGEATPMFEAAIRLQRQLRDDEPSDPQRQIDLALSHNNIGQLHSETGRPDQAKSAFLEAIELLERVAQGPAAEPDVLQNLAASYNNLAAIQVSESAPAAIETYRKAASHQHRAALARPSEPKYRRDFALTLSNLGSVQSRTRQRSAAAATFSRAIALQKELLQSAPQQRSYRGELAVSHNNLGLTLDKLGESIRAEICFREALALQVQLVSQSPRNLEMQSSLGGIYNNLGIVLEELGRKPEAAESYGKAIEHQSNAYRGAATIERYKAFLSKHYYNRGRVLRELNRADEAAQMALARKELWPGNAERLSSVAEELALAGKLLSGQQRNGLTAEQCAGMAIAALREAFEAGLRPSSELAHLDAFAVLRDMPAFTELFDE